MADDGGKSNKDQYNCSLNPIKSMIEALKEKRDSVDKQKSLQVGHLQLMAKTPFAKLFRAIDEEQILIQKKPTYMLDCILDTYNSTHGGFKFGNKYYTPNAVDLKLIFGLEEGDEDVGKETRLKKVESPFAMRRFADLERLKINDARDMALKLVCLTDDQSIQDTVRLLCLVILQSLFYTNSGLFIPWGFCRFVEDIEGMVKYKWSKHIVDYLLDHLKRGWRRRKSLNGCTIMLLYWLCERTTLITRRCEVGDSDDVPRAAKWDLLELNKVITPEELKKLDENTFNDGDMETTVNDLPGIHTVQAKKKKARNVKVFDDPDFEEVIVRKGDKYLTVTRDYADELMSEKAGEEGESSKQQNLKKRSNVEGMNSKNNETENVQEPMLDDEVIMTKVVTPEKGSNTSTQLRRWTRSQTRWIRSLRDGDKYVEDTDVGTGPSVGGGDVRPAACPDVVLNAGVTDVLEDVLADVGLNAGVTEEQTKIREGVEEATKFQIYNQSDIPTFFLLTPTQPPNESQVHDPIQNTSEGECFVDVCAMEENVDDVGNQSYASDVPIHNMEEGICCVDVPVGGGNIGVAEGDMEAEKVYADVGEEYDDIDTLVDQGFEAFMNENRTENTVDVEQNRKNPKHEHDRVGNMAEQVLHLRKHLFEANKKVEELVKEIEERDIEDNFLKDAEMNKVGEWLVEDTLKEREKEIAELKRDNVKQAELMKSMEDEKKQIMIRLNAIESEKDKLVKEVNAQEENIAKWKAMIREKDTNMKEYQEEISKQSKRFEDLTVYTDKCVSLNKELYEKLDLNKELILKLQHELQAEKENTLLEAVSSATQTAVGLTLQQELREHADVAKDVAREDEGPNSMYRRIKTRARAMNEDTHYDYYANKKMRKDGSSTSNK